MSRKTYLFLARTIFFISLLTTVASFLTGCVAVSAAKCVTFSSHCN